MEINTIGRVAQASDFIGEKANCTTCGCSVTIDTESDFATVTNRPDEYFTIMSGPFLRTWIASRICPTQGCSSRVTTLPVKPKDCGIV
jgi:hypothetical protein